MTIQYETFVQALESLDKLQCIQLTQDYLKQSTCDLPFFYETILAQSLQSIAGNSIPVWQEHVRSGIVRTCLELCAPMVYKMAENQIHPTAKVLIFCQEEEYHELGARMTADFFTLLGFHSAFIGANTPALEAIDAIKNYQPRLICISVTNFYHLTKLQRLIDSIRTITDAKILIGGYATSHVEMFYEQIHADFYANSFQELVAVKEALYETFY